MTNVDGEQFNRATSSVEGYVSLPHRESSGSAGSASSQPGRSAVQIARCWTHSGSRTTCRRSCSVTGSRPGGTSAKRRSSWTYLLNSKYIRGPIAEAFTAFRAEHEEPGV